MRMKTYLLEITRSETIDAQNHSRCPYKRCGDEEDLVMDFREST